MVNQPKNLKFLTSDGFSLVELMCVCAIIAVLSSLGIEKFTALQIKAARSELVTNTRFMAIALTSYHASATNYGPDLSIGIQKNISSAGAVTLTDTCGDGNPQGVRFVGCQKMRYIYQSEVLLGDYTIYGFSIHQVFVDNSEIHIGDRSPTGGCRNWFGMKLTYWDWWQLDSSNRFTPVTSSMMGSPVEGDVMKTCF